MYFKTNYTILATICILLNTTKENIPWREGGRFIIIKIEPLAAMLCQFKYRATMITVLWFNHELNLIG